MVCGRTLAIAMIFSAGLFAQTPALTTIQDTLYEANGTRLNATAVISWSSFQASDSSNIAMQSITVDIVNGSLYVQLAPNTTATPSNPYTVTYSSDGLAQFQETWMVPPSASPLRVSAVRTSSTSLSGGGSGAGSDTGSGGSTGPIPESSVTGLTSDLAARPLKGSAFGTGRVAIVDQTGAIDTVVGNSTDCVYVGGASGPCFDATQLPTYSDGETPGGVVDGSNTSFVLAAQPSPAQSLILFRNGMAQKQGFDYTLTGAVVQFASGAGPQPGDTLVAWYRLPSVASQGGGSLLEGGLTSGPIFPTVNAQVICAAAGTQASLGTATTLGTCTIPANALGSGDRVEIRFLLAHSGKSSGFTYAVTWGATTVLQRTAGINDGTISGSADAAISSGATVVAGQSYGTVLIALPAFANAADSLASNLTIAFTAALSAAGTDSVSLVNYTVLRYPAIANP